MKAVCYTLTALLISVVFTGFHLDAATDAAAEMTTHQIQATYGKLPMRFEVNQGQTDPQVKFLVRGSGHTLFLTSTEAVLALRTPTAPRGVPYHKATELWDIQTPAPAVVRMHMVGANQNPKVTGLDELPGKSHYFMGNDPTKWHTNIATYAKVKYENVYPGVDLVYYGNQRQLEYDFVVAPGADPKAIALVFQGADKLEMDAHGDLILHITGGQIRMQNPLVYQEVDGVRKQISGSYVLQEKHQVSLQVAAYDGARPLVIDPVLGYSTYLGSFDDDVGFGITVDSSGNAYVTGVTSSTTFPTTNNFFTDSIFTDSGFRTVPAVFVTKFSATGSTLVYSAYLGGAFLGSRGNVGQGIAVDASGNAYVTGITHATDFPTVGPFQSSLGGGAGGIGDAFVTKLNATGAALIYSTYLGGGADDAGLSIAVDAAGNAYVTGVTSSSTFPTKNPFQAAPRGFSDAFVTKLDATGAALVYSTYLGGRAPDSGHGIAVDAAGNAYVTGETTSDNFPTANPFQARPGNVGGGGADAFVTKLNAAGSALIYSTYLGGAGGDDTGNSIAVDGAGNAYVTGTTHSTHFPTVRPLQPTCADLFSLLACDFGEAFVTKLNAAGSALVYSTYLSSEGFDQGLGIAVDATGNAYVVGQSVASQARFPQVNILQETSGGEAFVTKLNADGSALVYSTYLGGSRIINAIAVDAAGSAYVTGSTNATNFPIKNPFQEVFRGSGFLGDAFVTKIVDASSTPTPQVPVANPGAAQTVNTGTTVTLDGSKSSDPAGQALTFTWTQTAGPAVTLSNAQSAMPTFTAPQVTTATTFTFQLVVKNATTSSAPTTVNVTVQPVQSGGGDGGGGGGGGCTMNPHAAFDPTLVLMLGFALGLLPWRQRRHRK